MNQNNNKGKAKNTNMDPKRKEPSQPIYVDTSSHTCIEGAHQYGELFHLIKEDNIIPSSSNPTKEQQ
jgi:hypothetical protein